MNKEQLYDTIEAYLEGKLTAEARRAFEGEIAADPELKREVALHRRMQQELGKSGKAELRGQLRQIAQEFPLDRKRRATLLRLAPVWGAVAAAIIAAVIWWAWPRVGPSTLQQGPAIVSDTPPGEQTAVSDSLVAVQPAPEKEEATPSPQPKQPSTAPPGADPFRPNPKLEGLAAATGGDANFLVSATANAAPTSSENFRATVAGTLRAGSPADDARIQLQIYDNQPASYLKERPATSIALELQQLDDEEVQGFGRMKNYTFKKAVDKELPPGLYYYVIKREGEDTPLFVGKVEIRKED
ncbi:MAG: hypothetical protein H6573_11340 [Lewinellaceae bacterium]|nr:hypothetical protein [Phaeodactylibacter sp.]MCB9348085.1 hypothetical protein [Lewinellaceae bacterium]